MKQDSWDRTGQIRQGRDNRGRSARVWQLGQVNLGRTGETEQNREGKSGHDSNARIAVSGEPWTRLFGQESLHRRAG